MTQISLKKTSFILIKCLKTGEEYSFVNYFPPSLPQKQRDAGLTEAIVAAGLHNAVHEAAEGTDGFRLGTAGMDASAQ